MCISVTVCSSLRNNILDKKYDSVACRMLLLCYVTIFGCFRFQYIVRAVKDGEKKEGKFIK